jgi:hypothetical protein
MATSGHSSGQPMTLSNMRSLGVREVYLDCECGRTASVATSSQMTSTCQRSVIGIAAKSAVADPGCRGRTGKITARQDLGCFEATRMRSAVR